MTEHLKMVRENAYYKVCIINLIEAIENVKELRSIKEYLKDVIVGVEPNTHKENADKIADFFKKNRKGSGVNE